MQYLSDALAVVVGALLMAVPAYAALGTLIARTAPNTVVTAGGGDLGALVAMGLFALGAFFVAMGLFGGLAPEVRQA